MKPDPILILARIRMVLVSTSQRGNIGAAARALKTMGITQLHLVTPRFDDALTHPEATAFAANASDVLANARLHATLDEALAGCTWTVALTARSRDISIQDFEPRAAAAQAITLASSYADADADTDTDTDTDGAPPTSDIAFVFGSERYGLDNEDVMKCQARCTLPTSPDYTSLNLAQAVQIMAYECRMAALEKTAVAHDQPEDIKENLNLATHEEREQFFTHLQQALIALEFLNAEHPKKLMQRLRRLFARARLEHEEVSILRGICTAILSPRRKDS